MTKQIIIIFIAFTVALGSANAQERLFFTDQLYETVTTDLAGNVYLTQEASLDVYTPDGALRRNYSNPTWGNISRTDAGIASKIMVFYRENGYIQLLDNELAPIGNLPISLFDYSMMEVSLVAMGGSDRLVLYDENKNLLVTDLNMHTKAAVHDPFPTDFKASDMQVVPEHRIALLDTLQGIFLFDIYCTLVKTIPIPGIQKMQLEKDYIIYLKDNQLYKYSFPTAATSMEVQPLGIPLPEVKDFHLHNGVLYYIDSENRVYRQSLTKGR